MRSSYPALPPSLNSVHRAKLDSLRERFLRNARQAAGPSYTTISYAQELDGEDLNGQWPQRVAVFSIGNGREAHGPCLPLDIDDRVGAHVAVAVCNRTGARYLGPIPFCTDGMGELARNWSTASLSYERFHEKVSHFIDSLLTLHYEDQGAARPDLLYLVSGHGGNNIMQAGLSRMAQHCRVSEIHYSPAIVDNHAQHAGSTEHSVAATLGSGCFDPDALAECNARLSAGNQSCFELLSEFPALGGMAGFYLFGGTAFNVIREKYEGVKRAVKEIVENRALIVSKETGKRVLEHSIQTNCRRLLVAATALGIESNTRVTTRLSCPPEYLDQ